MDGKILALLKKPVQIFICTSISCNMQFTNKSLYEYHCKELNHNSWIKEHWEEETVGIYVRGFHTETTTQNDLLEYFQQFGKISWMYLGHDFILINFTDNKSVEKILNTKNHILNDSRLMVKRKEPKINSVIAVNDEESNQKIFEEIINELKELNDFDEEFLCMAQRLQPNLKESYEMYNKICQDIDECLKRNNYTKFRVHPFGSTLTGLEFNNSDIDVFIENIKGDSLNNLHKIKYHLGMSAKFANCFVVAAKIPIVKCVHINTKIKCDISTKNMLGVYNSRLIHYYINKIDIKVKKLMLIIKYWAKSHQITRRNFSNYSLVMLVIFFLQQPPYYFPAVCALEEEIDRNNFKFSQWNSKFDQNFEFFSLKFTSTPLLNLVKEFYQFYSQFSYSTDVICPYVRKAIAKIDFETNNLPDFYHLYKLYLSTEEGAANPFKLNFINLQDPFEHCRNITGLITEKLLENFITICKLGKDICDANTNVLFKLLTEKPEIEQKIEPVVTTVSNETFQMALIKSALTNQYLETINKKWFNVIVDFLMLVFKDFLQFKCVIQSDNDDEGLSLEKSVKLDNQKDIHDYTEKSLFSLICSTRYNLWLNRKTIMKSLKLTKDTPLRERETAITDNLKNNYKNIELTTNLLKFQLDLIQNDDEKVEINLGNVTAYKKSFKNFQCFLESNLPLWYKQYEKELYVHNILN